jgi:hypothetical protein
MKILDFIAKRGLFLAFLCIFVAGWLTSTVYSDLSGLQFETPFSFRLTAPELESPFNHIEEDQIHIYSDRVVIDLEDAMWARFTNTNSMDPIFDSEANTIEIKPEKKSDVHVGDVISYRPGNSDSLIVHRVVQISVDGDGWYAIVKGDNIANPDPDKVRFEQINGVLVAIIY